MFSWSTMFADPTWAPANELGGSVNGEMNRDAVHATFRTRTAKSARLQVNLDAYNAWNSSAIQALNNTFGLSWMKPTQILDPRILQVSCQLAF